MSLGFYINNKNCYGCKTCSVACTTARLPENNTTFMRHVIDIKLEDPMVHSFLPLSCNHCENPACIAVCPVAAYEKLENGIVLQDHSLCIGCKKCIEACPYDAPTFNEAEGKTHKCDLCKDRIERGEQPACVEACPGANLAYGELNDLLADHPNGVNEIAGVTPSPDITSPTLVIEIDPLLV